MKKTKKRNLLESTIAVLTQATEMDDHLWKLYEYRKITIHIWDTYNRHACTYGKKLWNAWLHPRGYTALQIRVSHKVRPRMKRVNER